ncbi:MAG: flagellar basal body-associated FliL family protein [Oleispira sp.]|jgi:flagellar FliL protein|nr:flagellar basal body-associated FliL family protein [Oleispira sp.]
MATEQDLKLDQANPESEGGGKKKLIIIVVAIVVLIAVAVGATVFLMSGDSEEVPIEEVAEVVEEVSIPAQYIKMKPRFIVNFNVGTRQRFLQTSIEIMTRSQGVVDAVELHNPMLRNEIVRILSAQDFKKLRTPEGRVELKAKLHDQLATVLKREADIEGVEAVLFTDFVMQ